MQLAPTIRLCQFPAVLLLTLILMVGTDASGEPPKPDKKHASRFEFVAVLKEGDAGFREGYQNIKLRLGSDEWRGAKITESTAWGAGNDGKDLWGWGGGVEAVWSEIEEDRDGHFFIYSLQAAGSSQWVTAMFRYTLSDGSKGVGQAIFPYSSDGMGEMPDASVAALSVSLKPRATLKGHPGLVYNVQFTSDGKSVVSSSARGSKQVKQDSNTLIAWSAADGGKTKVLIPTDQPITLFGIVGGGKQAAIGKNDYVAIYDLKTTRETAKLPGPGMVSPTCVTATEAGTLVAAGLQNSDIVVWDMKTKKPATRTLKGHTGAVISLALSPDGTQLASGGSDNSIRLWDVATGKVRHVLSPEGNDSPVAVVRYSHDGSTLATCGNTVYFWDPKTGEAKKLIPSDQLYGTRAFAFSPDGKLGASTSVNLEDYKRGEITVWDLASKQKVAKTIDADGLVYDVCFSPDGKVLASGGGETVKLWTITVDETR